MKTYFVDILLPVPLPRLFTYRIKDNQAEEIEVGKRAVVPFGKSKLYSGIIHTIHENPPKDYEAKYVEAIIDDTPSINPIQLKFWNWLAAYYMCTLGEVMQTALPSGLKLQSETKLTLHPNFDGDTSELEDREFLITEALQAQNLITLQEVSEILVLKQIHPIVKRLIDKQVILAVENLKNKYKPKRVDYVRLTKTASEETELKQILDKLEKAPAQLKLVLNYIKFSNFFSDSVNEVKKTYLTKVSGVASSALNSLVKKNIFEVYTEDESRLLKSTGETKRFILSESQQKAYSEIQTSFDSKQTVLLHGVTSSGKTEIYIELIQACLEQKKQILYLVPEIALTTQLIKRLQRAFGDKVGVYHSKFNENERVETWNELLKAPTGRFDIIIGARSALFLPFTNLGLVIVDEEHETTFRQLDPAPRYNGRDAAILLASYHKAKVLLGSATPSLETMLNCSQKKFGYVKLSKRHGNMQLPEIFTVDIKQAKRRREMKAMFSSFLIQHMEETLREKKQVILFQNRRGFSPYIQCQTCGHIPECRNCDITLTYHKYAERLICHYCGYSEKMPSHCNQCHSSQLELQGFGTEKIEEELQDILPKARIKRMDLDTTRSKNAYATLIEAFEQQEIDILVGTQMVTKGLDFDHVGLVGIIDADALISFPDFRSQERAYQLMMQVAGRAGRKNDRGKVIIQTTDPYQNVIQQVIDNRFTDMVKEQLFERKQFKYPPYFKLIRLTLKSEDPDFLSEETKKFGKQLKQQFGNRVIGPQTPLVGKINNKYLKNILIKLEDSVSFSKFKHLLQKEVDVFYKEISSSKIRVNIHVDP